VVTAEQYSERSTRDDIFGDGVNVAARLEGLAEPGGICVGRVVRDQMLEIRTWKPWERSTGPRTTDGKTRVARNADKGGIRATLRALAKALREQRAYSLTPRPERPADR